MNEFEKELKTIATESKAAAESGAKLLDEKKPGWAERISTERLSMPDACSCVVGQLFGVVLFGEGPRFSDATDALGIKDGADAYAHGFDSPYGVDGYRLLEEAWLFEIEQRV